jgi:uracil-DNA glycosylase family 4
MPRDADRKRAELEERLKFFRDIGADFVFKPERRVRTASAPVAPVSARAGAGAVPAPVASGAAEAAGVDLGLIRDQVLACRKCRLAAGRTQAVPGEGDPAAELMFVGEGPGRDEDLQGRPFVGRAGQLLTKIIGAMKFERSQVFIANMVKCRPPDNRVPQRDEIDVCTPFLVAQIAAIRPKVIVTLGKVATDYFVPHAFGGMTSIRGRFYDWNGIPVMPTFHPSYLVRNEGNVEIKKMVWDDMKQVLARLGRT